jgi:hypothetical protein
VEGMRQATLEELLACRREYRKVKSLTLDKVAWKRDKIALNLAIEHAKQGKPVYIQESLGDGERYYYLLANEGDATTELHAPVCASYIANK